MKKKSKSNSKSSSIYVPVVLRDRFNSAAKEWGMRGPEFLAFLLECLPQHIIGSSPEEIWGRFFSRLMPLASELGSSLIEQGKGLKTEFKSESGLVYLEQFDL